MGGGGQKRVGSQRHHVWSVRSQVAPGAVTFRAEETELPDKPRPCPAAQSSLSFLLCQGGEWPWVPAPQSRCWAGFGGQLEPPRKHLHIPDACGQRWGRLPGPSPAPPPRCWLPCWKQGLRGMGSGGVACTCYVTGSSRASSCLLPPAGQDSAVGGRHPTPQSRAQGSRLLPLPPALLVPGNAASVGPAAAGGPTGSEEKQVPLSEARGAPNTAPEKPGAGRREERPQCWSGVPQGIPANTSALRPGSATHSPPHHLTNDSFQHWGQAAGRPAPAPV